MCAAGASVAEVDAASLTPASMWQHFISQRQPVLIRGQLMDPSWKAPERWTDAYLQQHAGTAVVQVERRDSSADAFGRGRLERMAFGNLLRACAAGDETLYMTTQEAAVASDGHPELLSAPLTSLHEDFPLQPALMGHLVPQSINLWVGATSAGASSGLHHDFHDNLYCLLRGAKRFRLFPPRLAGRMYTHGSIAHVHANGRIVYRGQGVIRPDGADASRAAQWEARDSAERAVAAAEADVARGVAGARKCLRAAERQLEEVLEAALDGKDEFDGSDDYVEEDKERADGGAQPWRGKAGAPRSAVEVAAQPQAASGEPPSFSRVDLSAPAQQLRKRFPQFPGAHTTLSVTVKAGQMLYLPAGWFHEVTSYSDGERDAHRNDGGRACPLHMALNYWFHPPDHLDSSISGFKKPYTRRYYPSLWEQRLARLPGEQVVHLPPQGQSEDAPPDKPQHLTRLQRPGTPPTKRRRAQQGADSSAAHSHANGAQAVALPLAGLAALNAGLAGGVSGSVRWGTGVVDAGNCYRQSMTKEGTASGSAHRIPVLKSLQQRQQQRRKAQGLQPEGNAAEQEEEGAGNAAEQEDGPLMVKASKDAVAQYLATQPGALDALLQHYMMAAAGQGTPQPRLRAPPGRRHHLHVVVRDVVRAVPARRPPAT